MVLCPSPPKCRNVRGVTDTSLSAGSPKSRSEVEEGSALVVQIWESVTQLCPIWTHLCQLLTPQTRVPRLLQVHRVPIWTQLCHGSALFRPVGVDGSQLSQLARSLAMKFSSGFPWSSTHIIFNEEYHAFSVLMHWLHKPLYTISADCQSCGPIPVCVAVGMS
jgi:hypothetical protein